MTKKLTNIIALAGLAMAATPAFAGGIDRSGQSITALFEEGRYVEFSFGHISPDISGSLGVGSGDMAKNYSQIGGAYKADINDQWSYAIIIDQPFGADVNYPVGTGYFAQGATADLDTFAITGLLQYNMPSNVSLYGGLRAQRMKATASIPFVGGYSGSLDAEWGLGYVVGVAYERPEIAMRVSLTYNSKVSYDFATTETSIGGTVNAIEEVETPQSVNLDFQTGIAKDTLLFGGVRWVDWSDFEIAGTQYRALTGGGSLVSYDSDSVTWTLGVGRKLNDNWSIAGSFAFEKSSGGIQSNLGPTDGSKRLNLAAVYTQDNMRITTGISYIKIGDARTSAGGPLSSFTDNDAVAVGVKVGYSF